MHNNFTDKKWAAVLNFLKYCDILNMNTLKKGGIDYG